jgi:hypothetical protein
MFSEAMSMKKEGAENTMDDGGLLHREIGEEKDLNNGLVLMPVNDPPTHDLRNAVPPARVYPVSKEGSLEKWLLTFFHSSLR